MYKVKNNSESLLSLNGSKFYSYGYEIWSENEAKQIIENLREQNRKAVHVCYGYVIKVENNIIERFDDDGEPKHSAGKRILSCLKDNNFMNSLIVVVRYKTKTMLGLGLLTRSYYNAAELILKDDKNKINYVELVKLKVSLKDAKELNEFFKFIKNYNNNILNIDQENNYLELMIDKQALEVIKNKWNII